MATVTVENKSNKHEITVLNAKYPFLEISGAALDIGYLTSNADLLGQS